MKIEDLLRDEALRRHEFPVTADKIFLAHAGVSPLPRCVAEAMREYLGAAARGDQEAVFPRGRMLETRKLAAELLGCTAPEIALVGPTALGLSLVAGGLEFPPGSNVVCYGDDYPANVYPWRAIRWRHPQVEVRGVRTRRLGEVTVDAVAVAVDERTRLVALASAHYQTGWRLDIAAIGKFLRERGILFCVDGIQTLGAMKTTVEHADFLSADSHKWLLGPNGAGVFFARREQQEKLRPVLVGAGNVACPDFIAQDELALPPNAGRYECGSPYIAGIVGLRACLMMFRDIGIKAIERRVLSLARWLVEKLRAKGYEIAGPTEGAGLSGIVSCRKPGAEMAAIHAALTAKNIVASLRATRDGTKLLRFSPHFYNTETELERVVALLP